MRLGYFRLRYTDFRDGQMVNPTITKLKNLTVVMDYYAPSGRILTGDDGFKIVMLTRLSPLFPFTLLNYAFGLTKVRFRDYLLASWLGMLPGTVMYVYLGSSVKELADVATGNVESGPPARLVLFFVGLAATVAVTVYVTRLARRALRQAVPDAQTEGAVHV